MYLLLPLLLCCFLLASAVDSLATDCEFDVGKFSFDLCPLLQQPKEVKITLDEDTPPTHTTKTYRLSIGGGSLSIDKTLPLDLQCPDKTSGCLTVANTRPSHPSEPVRILQVIPIAMDDTPTAYLWNRSTEEHAPLILEFKGASYGGAIQKTAFVMRCRPDSKDLEPQYSWTFNNTHLFNWDSPYACHKALENGQQSVPLITATATASPAEDTDVNPPEVPGESEDLRDNPDRAEPPRHIFRTVVIIVALASTALFLLHFLFVRRRESILNSPRLLHFNFNLDKLKLVGGKRRNRRQFRPPPNRLVEWATQSYPIGLESGEEWEEVPLAPHPDLPSRSKSSYGKGYGSL